MQTKPNQHPSSLPVFFATEMWERYGFYVVQTLLALYLALHHHWSDEKVYTLVGSFTALTYLSPIIGGWIADHLLGQKRSVLTGSVILFFSYLGLGLEASDSYLTYLLAGIAVGTGLLKPNISSLLGNEYQEGSPHRESGFTIFYMGITTGIILGTTLPSYLNLHFGWSLTFLSAAFGLIIALMVFSYGIYHHRIADYSPYQNRLSDVVKAALLIFGLWWGCHKVLISPHIANLVFALVIILAIGYILIAVSHEKKQQAKKTMVVGYLCLISVLFWAFYFQMFLSLTLFLARVAKPVLFGIPFPPPYYVAIQSIGMILFGTILALRKHPKNLMAKGIEIGNKFLFSIFIISIAYALITLVSATNINQNLISPLYFLPAYLLISLAELLLSPVGLSAVTLLVSPKRVSTMMGIFFVSLGVGSFVSGKLAYFSAVPDVNVPLALLKLHYFLAFKLLTLILLVATVICVVLNRQIRSLMGSLDENNSKPLQK